MKKILITLLALVFTLASAAGIVYAKGACCAQKQFKGCQMDKDCTCKDCKTTCKKDGQCTSKDCKCKCCRSGSAACMKDGKCVCKDCGEACCKKGTCSAKKCTCDTCKKAVKAKKGV